MPGTMWRTVNSNLFYKWSPIAVIVIAIAVKQMDYEKANERVKEANE